jgi:hypothetical protein
VIRTSGLPSVAFRKIGEQFAESKATFEPVSERIFDLGGFIDVDKVLVSADPKQRAIHTDAFLTSLAYTFNDYFINGNPTVDVDGFTGLQYRLNELIPGSSELDQTVLGGGNDVSPDAASLSANFDTLLDQMDDLVHRLEGHMGNMLLMNRTLYLRVNSALRQKGLWSQDQDNFGRLTLQYGPDGPFIKDLGVQADQSTFIIGNTELDDGSANTGGDATSMYAVRTGEKYLGGMFLYDIDVQDIGLLESGVAFRTVVDWPVGIMHVNPRSFARLVGTVAA